MVRKDWGTGWDVEGCEFLFLQVILDSTCALRNSAEGLICM